MRRTWQAAILAAALVAGTAVPAAARSGFEAAATSAGSTALFAGETLGLYDPLDATWYLQDVLGRTVAFRFGGTRSIPISGDWDGDGFDGPGTYSPETGLLSLNNTNRTGVPQAAEMLPPGGIPVAADGNGDGRDEVALIVGGDLVGGDLAPAATTQAGRLVSRDFFVPPGVIAATAADTDGDGRDEIWMRDEQGWWVEGSRAEGPVLGSNDRPVLADFDGDGRATMAVFRPDNAEFWLLAGNGVLDGTTIMPYGSSRMQPVAGRFGVPEGAPTAPPRLLDIPPLQRGDTGQDVVRLQTELAARALYRGRIDGDFGPATSYAVMAFHKAAGLERTWEWQPGDTEVLATFEPTGFPYRPDEPDRIEVDLGRQVLFFIEDQEVTAVVPVSSGGGYTYYSKRSGRNVRAHTPRGDFRLLRHSRGWSCDPLYGWCIYKPWNFTQYYAIHGYNSVPAYPASHGCVRIPNWDADYLESDFYIGLPVHVWDVMPVIEPAADEPGDQQAAGDAA